MREEFLEIKRTKVAKENEELREKYLLALDDVDTLDDRIKREGIYDVDGNNIINMTSGAIRAAMRLARVYYAENKDTLHDLAIAEDRKNVRPLSK